MHLVLGSRSERGGARRAPTKRVKLIAYSTAIISSILDSDCEPIWTNPFTLLVLLMYTDSQNLVGASQPVDQCHRNVKYWHSYHVSYLVGDPVDLYLCCGNETFWVWLIGLT